MGTIPPDKSLLGSRSFFVSSFFSGIAGCFGGTEGILGASLTVGLLTFIVYELTWTFLLGFGATGGGTLFFLAAVLPAKLILTELDSSFLVFSLIPPELELDGGGGGGGGGGAGALGPGGGGGGGAEEELEGESLAIPSSARS